MAVHLEAHLVRETPTEVEYVYGSSPAEVVSSPRCLVVAKAGRDDPDRWDLRVWPAGDEGSAARALRGITRRFREKGDPAWPRHAYYAA